MLIKPCCRSRKTSHGRNYLTHPRVRLREFYYCCLNHGTFPWGWEKDDIFYCEMVFVLLTKETMQTKKRTLNRYLSMNLEFCRQHEIEVLKFSVNLLENRISEWEILPYTFWKRRSIFSNFFEWMLNIHSHQYPKGQRRF